jgi:hypothetical protein
MGIIVVRLQVGIICKARNCVVLVIYSRSRHWVRIRVGVYVRISLILSICCMVVKQRRALIVQVTEKTGTI